MNKPQAKEITMQITKPTVVLARAVDEALERLLSPMDELVFLQQIHRALPELHQPKRPLPFFGLRRNSLRVYRGLVDWCGIHFLYLQFDDHLHVLRFEPSCDDDRYEADVQLGEPTSDDLEMQEADFEDIIPTARNAIRF
jgi:hypothetical protein